MSWYSFLCSGVGLIPASPCPEPQTPGWLWETMSDVPGITLWWDDSSTHRVNILQQLIKMSMYCICRNFRQETIFANFATHSHWRKFLHANLLSCIKDYIDDVATFNLPHWQIFFHKFFLQYKGSWAWRNFLSSKNFHLYSILFCVDVWEPERGVMSWRHSTCSVLFYSIHLFWIITVLSGSRPYFCVILLIRISRFLVG